jgi:peptidoglycan/LPS O-acetylase OafA/YrhL
MDSLVVGIAVGLVKRHRPEAFAHITRRPNLLFLAGFLAVYAPFVLADGTRLREVVILGGQAIGFGLVMTAALSGRLALRHVLASPPAHFVALTSYSIYLTHGDPVFWVGRWATSVSLPPLVQSGVVIAGGFLGSVVVGAIIYYLVERPGMKLRDRYFPRR